MTVGSRLGMLELTSDGIRRDSDVLCDLSAAGGDSTVSLYSNHCRILGSAVAVQPFSETNNTVGTEGSAKTKTNNSTPLICIINLEL